MIGKMDQKEVQARQNCIGCRDCAGLCQALLELAFVPETVLKTSHAPR